MEEEKGFFPAEVLDMIFSLSETEDIKRFRLVNHSWRSAAKRQMDTRVALQLQQDADLEENTIVQKLKKVNVEDFQNLILVKNIPKTVEAAFQETLVSLTLKDVTFTTVDDFKRIIFQVFGNMKELGLKNVLLSRNPRHAFSRNIEIGNILPKVTKLLIERSSIQDARKGRDIFEALSLNEVVRAFASSLLEITVSQGREQNCLSNDRMDFFGNLQSSNISLAALSYGVVETQEEVCSLKSYLGSHGKNLKRLQVEDTLADLFSRLYEDSTITMSPYENLKIATQDWNHWDGQELVKLQRIWLDQNFVKTLEWVKKMPNLRTVEIEQSHLVPMYTNSPHVLETVNTLRLTKYHARDIAALRQTFPNIQELIVENPCGECIRQNLGQVLLPFCTAWPNLLHLEMRGCWFKFLRSLLSRMRDRKRKQGRGLGNELIDEFRVLRKLSGLRSFVNQDDESLGIWYGDRSAIEVFLKLPALRTLRIGRCSMSVPVLESVREKCMVFTYKKRS